jgi:hypothetical protein
MNLEQIGIDVGFLVSGLFGAILMVSKTSSNNMKQTIISVLGGMASANYLTPVILDLLKITDEKLQNGLAFIVGFLGLKLVEVVSQKLMGKIEEPQVIPIKQKPVKKPVKKNVHATKY